MQITNQHNNVYALIGLHNIPVSITTPATHIANLAYRNNVAYDDIVWIGFVSVSSLRNAVYKLMAPDDNFSTYRVTLTHKIDPSRDIIAYVKAPSRPSAIELVASLIMHNHSVAMYDAISDLV